MSNKKQPCGFVEFWSHPNMMNTSCANYCYSYPRILPFDHLGKSLELTRKYGMITIAVLKIYLKN